VGRPRCCGRRAGAWMAAGAMQLPPSRWDLRRRRARRPAPGSGGPARAARPVIPLTTRAAGYGRIDAAAEAQPHRLPAFRTLRGRVRVTRDQAQVRGPCSHASPAAPRGEGAPLEDHAQQRLVVPAPGSAGAGDPGISSCKPPGPLTALHPPAQSRCPASRRRPRHAATRIEPDLPAIGATSLPDAELAGIEPARSSAIRPCMHRTTLFCVPEPIGNAVRAAAPNGRIRIVSCNRF
jgi:hypothetical protein